MDSIEKHTADFLMIRLGKEGFQRLIRIDNPDLHRFIARYVVLCNPDRVFICTDTPEDIDHIRQAAIRNGEERPLAIAGHTVHFDAYGDQGRDRENTAILVPKGVDLGSSIVTKDREEGLREVHAILKDIMRGRELFVCFFTLGPVKSEFGIPCVQLTDSAYVAHSEDLLYRFGYEEFVRRGRSATFFKFVHSQGELDERNVSMNLHLRRIYIDLEGNTVYSTNTQYGGNTIGLKKLAMRLAIHRASKEGWLTEHMLIMGINGPNGRVTYFTAAYPSRSGKTATAMMQGEQIVGDDIAYLHKKDGEVRAVNVEKGMFGIIHGVNSMDEPIQWEVLHRPGEIIFSNVLVTGDGHAYWEGADGETPPKGFNHSGPWFLGKKDSQGKEIPCSHPNARFTLNLRLLPNLDPIIEDPEGVKVDGIVYGGRDSDTCVPVEEAFDWEHGIITKGAALESETTAAVLGKEGVREFNPMSNLDFLSIPLGKYIQNNLDFGKGLKRPPRIFSVNYFIRDKDGSFLNHKDDKRVWFKWMELRIHEEVDAIETPTGRIPHYGDLAQLFKMTLQKDYPRNCYVKQFTLRIPEHLAKIERIEKIYRETPDTPPCLFEILQAQRERLKAVQQRFGDYVSPDSLCHLPMAPPRPMRRPARKGESP